MSLIYEFLNWKSSKILLGVNDMNPIRFLSTFIILLGNFAFLFSQTNTNLGDYSGNYGSNNTSVGYFAGYNVTGNDNSLIGSWASQALTSGNANVISGYYSGRYLSTGKQSLFIGDESGRNTTTGYYNTFIGSQSGYSNTTGIGNTYLGSYSGFENNTGNYNLFLGNQSGLNSIGSRNVFIGHSAGYTDTIGSHHLIIENTDSSNSLIYGEFDNDLLSVSGNMGIGTKNVPDSIQLAVNGTVVAKKGIITIDYFPDFVFNPSYDLLNIKEVEEYIKSKGHLPEISCAKHIESTGMQVGEMQTLLLKKVEELTLYIIELEEENEKIKNRISSLKKSLY